MHTHKKKRRGLAIITTLMIITLLLALVGAFLMVNRAGNRFTTNSIERRTAQDACQSAFTYARFQLEQDRRWGTAAVPASGTVTYPDPFKPKIRMTLSQVVGPNNVDGNPTDEVTATGVYSPTGNFSSPVGTFTLKVRNNLNSRSPAPGVVPKRAVKIEVVSTIAGTTRELNALLRPKPIAHESASAGTNLDLSDVDGLVRFASDDPYTNQIRAGEDIHLPDVDDVRFVKHGVASSGDELNLGGLDLSSASAAIVRSAGETAGGVFSPNAALHNFSEFDPEKYVLPASIENEPGGNWVFGDITHYEFRSANVPYSIDVPNGPDINGSVSRYQRRTSLYNSLTAPDGQRWTASTAIPGSTTDWEPPLPSSPYDSYGEAASFGYGTDASGLAGGGNPDTVDVHQIAPGFIANVVTAQFVVRSGKQIRFNGDFIVTGEGDRSPELYFGYNMDADGVVSQESLADGREAAQDDPGRYMGALVANGDLNVTGGVLGYGSMIAGGQLTIKASSGLRTAPGLGIVVKGNDVVVNPATEPEPALPGEPVEIDNVIFTDAITLESGGDWTDYNEWLEHDATTRDSIVGDLAATDAGASASTFWTRFDSEIGGGGPLPTALLSSNGWPGGNINIDQYVRLKTFYQTKASLYNNGDGQPEWLDFNQKQNGARDRVELTVTSIAQNAESHKLTFREYLENPPSDVPDMYIEGIVYGENNVNINAGDGSIKLEGAVVAKNGNLTINDATKADLVYSRNLLDDLATGSTTIHKLPLETVFMTVN